MFNQKYWGYLFMKIYLSIHPSKVGEKYTSLLKLYCLLFEISLQCNTNNNTNTSDSFDIYITP